ncbi:integrase catalytic domain-containing protein [Trichonephila inaurata madagascariensis]|uniref:Integrase catalytic domain-containing protein n=1 Tax=Trichonephila inaurata madagascariensis TaxID=2747483 RepID=A0A8X6YLI1_9ARAC|nr:integrase catalytic domain-containing protein [Trichonephila inaurata madagascariensis]
MGAVIANRLVKHFKRIFKDIKRIVMWKQGRFNSNSASQVIAPLPDVRVTESPPFAGTDLRNRYSSKTVMQNSILLITCEITRSFHLELVGSMTTDIFLLALRRFIARGGLCFKVILNNSRMFKRAELVLQQMWKVLIHADVKSRPITT